LSGLKEVMDMVLAGLLLLLLVIPLAAFLFSVAIGRGWAWGRGDIVVVHKSWDEYDREQEHKAKVVREQLSEPDEM